MQESKERKRGVILSYIAIITNTLIQLLYTPILIRRLGQSEYGLYSLVASIIGYLSIMDLGFGNAIIVYTSKYRAQGKIKEEQKLHSMFNVIFKIIGFFAAFLAFILYLNVNLLFGNTMTDIELQKTKIMMLILSFNLFISFYFAIYNSIISAYEKFTFQKIIAIIHMILKPIIMIPLLFLGYKSITLCIIITLTNIFAVLSNYLYCKKRLKIKTKYQGMDKVLFKTIFGYSIWIFLGIIVDKINWSVDNFVLGAVSGTIAVSVYSIASTLNQLFITLGTSVSGIMLPKMSKMVSKNATNDELTNEFIKVGRIQYYIIFLMCSGLILVGKEFFVLWAGTGYESAYYIALLLIIPACISLIQNLGISIRQAKNKHKFPAIIRVIVAILNLIISIPLAKKYGAIGAAFGTTIGLIISTIIQNIYYHFSIKINVIKFWKTILKMTIPFVIPWIVVVVFKNLLIINGLKSIIIYGGLFTLLYCLVAYKFCMNTYEKDIFKTIPNKLIKISGRKENK